ncbi:MAG: hypothetical protein HYX51_01335, partial [Chloroflexi bacterium]|nr:hypothetical protein [Chloroflexota bacterium]
MTALELLRTLDRRGVEFTIDGDRLRYRAPAGALTPELRDAAVRLRPAMVTLLRVVKGEPDNKVSLASEVPVAPSVPAFARFTFFPTASCYEANVLADGWDSARSDAGAWLWETAPTPKTWRLDRRRCYACGSIGWWLGAMVVQCNRCAPASAWATAADQAVVLGVCLSCRLGSGRVNRSAEVWWRSARMAARVFRRYEPDQPVAGPADP